LTFSSDGTFVGSGLPRVVFDPLAESSKIDWKDPIAVQGVWNINDNGSVGVKIAGTNEVRGFDTFLSVRLAPGGIVLVRTIGDADSGSTFSFSRK
jgi:hypothetical protein